MFKSTATIVIVGILASAANARDWADSTGHYHVEADLIGYSNDTVVLKKKNHDLVSVSIKQLSAKDQEYLKTEEAAAATKTLSDAPQSWTMRSGLKVVGKVVNYARQDVVIQRIRGKLYVNNKLFDNLDSVYREMIPKIVAHFEKTEIDGKKGLEDWVLKLRGAPKTFKCDGVLLELANGDLYCVPFFFFSDDDLKVLQPGWESWLAADKDQEQQEQQRFMLESQAQAYKANQQASRQVMQVQLQLQAYDAGLFDLWEVALFPRSRNGIPQQVVVPGRNSDQAAAAAMAKYPGYAVGSVAKVTRK